MISSLRVIFFRYIADISSQNISTTIWQIAHNLTILAKVAAIKYFTEEGVAFEVDYDLLYAVDLLISVAI